MDFASLQEYVAPVVVAICFCVGYVIKKWIKDVSNKWIPTICFFVGAFCNVWLNGWEISPEILLGGIASGLAATGLDQLIRTGEYADPNETDDYEEEV